MALSALNSWSIIFIVCFNFHHTDCKSEIEGVGLLGDIPKDESLEQDVDNTDDDIMFEMSETPHLQTYNLQLARDNG